MVLTQEIIAKVRWHFSEDDMIPILQMLSELQKWKPELVVSSREPDRCQAPA
jgi:hypothetical protein